MVDNGPVLIIEDDADDQYLLELVFRELNYENKLLFFSDGQEALDFLNRTDTKPFLILSDINMPRLNGFELKDKIKTDARLEAKCIPYLFFSSAVDQEMVIKAYSASAQGFFIKQNSMPELKNTISVIMEYWGRCAAPNNY